MTTALLYFATAAALLWLASRLVTPVTRWAGLVLVLLPLCFTGRALLTGQVYAPLDLAFQSEPLYWARGDYGIDRFSNPMLSDVYCLNIPWKQATRDAYAAGTWALWNPHPFAGDILAGAAQPTPYEPIFLLSLLLPMANSLTYLAAMAFFLAALCMYLYLRELGCSELSSVIGAVGWMYCGFLVFWLEWVITTSVLWLPLVFLGVRRIIRRVDFGSMLLLTIAFVMMIQNGHPESALHIVTVGVPYALFEFWQVRGRALVRAAALGIAAGVLALLISAIYLLPILEAIPQSREHSFRQEVYARVTKAVPPDEALSRMKKHFIPFAFGYFQREIPKPLTKSVNPDGAYEGSIVLAIALFGLWRSRRRERWFVLGMAIAGYVIGNGFPPFADWIGSLPLFDIALNERLIFATCFALAVLAAFGIDVLLDAGREIVPLRGSEGAASVQPGSLATSQPRNERLRFALVVALTGLSLAAWTAVLWHPLRASLSREFLMRESTSLLLPLLLALGFALASRSGRNIAIVCLLLVLMQRTAEMADFYPTEPARLFYPRIPLFDRLPRGGQPYRIVGVKYAFIANLATMYGLEDPRGYSAMTFRPLAETYSLWSVAQPVWYNRVDDLSRPFLSFLNVRYAVAGQGVPIPDGWRVVDRRAPMQLVENTRALGRAFVPRFVRTGLSEDAVLEEMAGQRDFGQTAWVALAGAPSAGTENGPGEVSVMEDATGLRLTARMAAPGWVVISQTAWKGWRAFLDGKRTRLHIANHAFLAVLVPAGTHHVRLLYLPRSFVIGRAITGATLAGIGIAVLLGWGRRRRPGAGAVSAST